MRPTLTLNSLRTVLTVATAERPLAYRELADLLGHDYEATAHQIAALDSGRGGRAGLGLLKRTGKGRSRLVTSTGRGCAFTLRFLSREERAAPHDVQISRLRERVIPALEIILGRNPGMTLGTCASFLYIASHEARFAYDGMPAKIISEALGISNLPAHLRVLNEGGGHGSSAQLIDFYTNEYDQRIRLPRLTSAGLGLKCDLVSALTGSAVETPRLPKPTSLDRLDSPEDIDTLDDDDFDNIEWQ